MPINKIPADDECLADLLELDWRFNRFMRPMWRHVDRASPFEPDPFGVLLKWLAVPPDLEEWFTEEWRVRQLEIADDFSREWALAFVTWLKARLDRHDQDGGAEGGGNV